MILQKSCHDMDILLWLLGRHCKSVSSYGSLLHFKPENARKAAPSAAWTAARTRPTAPTTASGSTTRTPRASAGC